MAYAKKIINVTYNKKSICFFAATEKETKQRSKKMFSFLYKNRRLDWKTATKYIHTHIHTYTHIYSLSSKTRDQDEWQQENLPRKWLGKWKMLSN